jgi:hypothetical protein
MLSGATRSYKGEKQCLEVQNPMHAVLRVRRIVSLGVEIINDRDIVVSHPESGLSVTYRKDGEAPMLVAIDAIDRFADREKLNFLVKAWKAAYQKASAIGWLHF